ncbi:Slp family lipoprotein [Acidihalobacter prosperus]|nr:Slp family lipoprotein [Acidihalobacter prosperus]
MNAGNRFLLGLAMTGVLALAGCATTPPFAPALAQQAQTAPAPQAVARNARAPATPMAWGGTIVKVDNEAHDTLITVLAYPLDDALRPKLRDSTIGRFIVRARGFVEPLIYAPGRELSVIGPVTGFRQGEIGQQPYQYPVVSEQAMHLWPLAPEPSTPRFQFGIGIGIGSRF